MVDRGEAEIGISNAMEVHDGLLKGFKELRIIAAAHALRVGFFVRKDGGIRTVADLKERSGCRTDFPPYVRSNRPCAPSWRRRV